MATATVGRAPLCPGFAAVLDDWVRRFHTDGYLFLPALLDAAAVAELSADLDRALVDANCHVFHNNSFRTPTGGAGQLLSQRRRHALGRLRLSSRGGVEVPGAHVL